MTTLPSEPGRFSVAESHRARGMAEGFGEDPERYDRARPRYPAAMVERIVAASPGVDILDVGVGTGIAARAFQAAGCRVLGVDVDARMADFARRHGLEVEVASFEGWDPAGRSFDAVVAGQTWHWVDPVAGAAKAAQVLRPDGRLAVFWNAFEPPADLADAFAAVYRRVLPDSPFSQGRLGGVEAYAAMCDKAAAGMADAGGFGQPERWRFDWARAYTKDEWLDQVPTSGGHNRFPPGKLDELLVGLGDAIDRAGGSFTMRYVTLVTMATRTATA